jgi:hypothetical protein
MALCGLRGPGTLLQTLPEERRPGTAACTLSNGMCGMGNSSSSPMAPLSQTGTGSHFGSAWLCSRPHKPRGYKGLQVQPPLPREHSPDLRGECVGRVVRDLSGSL